MSEEIHESLLDRHYKKQLRTLKRICAVHSHRTDFAICNKWLEVFDRASKEDKFARNCLMLLMYSQLAEVGQLGKPFVDMRNCTKALETVLKAYHGQWYDADDPRGAECRKTKQIAKLKQLEKPKPVAAEQIVAEKDSDHCQLCNKDLKNAAVPIGQCVRYGLAMSDDCLKATTESPPHPDPPLQVTPDPYCKICCIRGQNAHLLDEFRTRNGLRSEHIRDASYLLLEQRLEILHVELFHTRNVGCERPQHIDPKGDEPFGSSSADEQRNDPECAFTALVCEPDFLQDMAKLSYRYGNPEGHDLQRHDCFNAEGCDCSKVVVMKTYDTQLLKAQPEGIEKQK